MLKLSEAFSAGISDLALEWFSVWGSPQIHEQVRVRFSRRMYRSVGRCYPERKLVSLSETTREMCDTQVTQILGHELAHIAAHELFGHGIKPHGEEWRALVERIGYSPSVTFQANLPLGLMPNQVQRHPRYVHRCDICFETRVARRPMLRWHCAACVDNGLAGELRITRLDIAER